MVALAISSKFASLHPEKVKSLTLLGSPGLSVNTPLAARFAHVPIISDLVGKYVSPSVMIQRAERAYTSTIAFPF